MRSSYAVIYFLALTDMDLVLANKARQQQLMQFQEMRDPAYQHLLELFQTHKANSQSRYVFPNASGDSYFKEPRKVMRIITEQSNVTFILHDLRRTFASIAESLDISAYALKRLLNHKLNSSCHRGLHYFRHQSLKQTDAANYRSLLELALNNNAVEDAKPVTL